MVSEVLEEFSPDTPTTLQPVTVIWGAEFEDPYPERQISNIADKDPLARFKKTLNPDDFKELVDKFEGALRGYFLKRIRGHELADELTQQVFISLLTHGAGYDGTKGTLKGYVFRTACNTLNDYLRSRGRQKMISETDLGDVASKDCDSLRIFAAIADQSETNVDTKDLNLSAIMEKLLSQLRPKHAEILRLWSNNTPYGEMSEKLGIALGTVKSRLHQAIDRLKQLVENDCVPEAKEASDYYKLN